MSGTGWWTRRSRRGLRTVVAPAAAVLAVVLASTGLGAASAAFVASTPNPGNRLAADQLAPPTAFSVVQSCAAAPAIAFHGAGTATGTDSLTLAVPAGTVAGDVLLAQVAYAYTTATFTPAPGWALVRADNSANVVVSAVYTKTAVAGEPSAVFGVTAGAGVPFAGGIAAYGGVNTATPVDVSAGAVGYGGQAVTPAVTTTTSNTVLVRMIANASEAYPAPAGATQRWRQAAGPGAGVTGADEPFTGPGTALARTSNSPSATSGYGVGQTVALRQARPTPSAVLSWTATPSTWADGYRGQRQVGAAAPLTATVAMGVTSTTDGPLTNSVTYTYRLWAYRGSWTSAVQTLTFTPEC